MATSGTTTFNLDLGDIMEEAYDILWYRTKKWL